MDKFLHEFKLLIFVTDLYESQPPIAFDLYIELDIDFRIMFNFNHPIGEEWNKRKVSILKFNNFLC
jgi:hypothetical protein